MSLQSTLRVLARPAFAADLTACVELLPAWLPLDVKLRTALPSIWRELLFEPSFKTYIAEHLDPIDGNRLVALGMSIAVTEAWQERLRADPPQFLATHIYSGLMDGSFSPPTDAELCALNAQGKVSFVTLHYAQEPFELSDPATLSLYCLWMNAFRLEHSGYRLRQLYLEGCGRTELDCMEGMGWKPHTRRTGAAGRAVGGPAYPELWGLSSEQAVGLLPGTPVRDVFQFSPPALGFSPSERRVLCLAIYDLPDDVIGAQLGISGHTLKKVWRSIHERVATRLPSLYRGTSRAESGKSTTRGREKRRSLIPYLRQHLEELRPHAFAPATPRARQSP